MCTHHTKPFGSALEHGKAHEKNHKQWSRRNFLTSLGLAAAGGAYLKQLPLHASPLINALSQGNSNRILVLVQLKGGNDGLNTIIPAYDYGTYQANRSTIAIPQNQLTSLNSEIAIPNQLTGLTDLWNNDMMKVVQGVGYQGQNLSHFRSAEIWASASDHDDDVATGWLGRYADALHPNILESPPEIPPAVQIGGVGNLTFQGNAVNVAVTLANADRLERIIQDGQLYSLENLPSNCYGDELDFLRTITNSTFFYAETIKEAYDSSSSDADYENNEFASQLALVARLIKGNLGTRMYMVTLGGFDTHADQNLDHPQLLNQLSEAMSSFFDDLGTNGDEVLAMTFSEFGRRVEQNASNGTDHGSGAPLLLFGKGIEGQGVSGAHPSLTDLDGVGNLKNNYDFRQVYATIMQHWMCVDGDLVDTVLGNPFDRIPDLVADCVSVGINGATNGNEIGHRVVYGQGSAMIQYHLNRSSKVDVSIYNLDGRKITTLYSGRQAPGSHYAPFSNFQSALPFGQYIYAIETEQGRESGSFVLER